MRIVVTINADQKALLTRAATAAGLPLSLWLRATGIAAARGLGVLDPARERQKAEQAAGVTARREARKARRAARAAEDEAWAALAVAQDAESLALASGEGYEAARAARIAAQAVAEKLQAEREALAA